MNYLKDDSEYDIKEKCNKSNPVYETCSLIYPVRSPLSDLVHSFTEITLPPLITSIDILNQTCKLIL
ncbi:MAG: hypothetical protein AMS27_03915 [Bacteroides sp. SM23_62_1]|nr:MAG: hypothetical protein AMS27_03915 [Bacteroides sp. SM23_62_1]